MGIVGGSFNAATIRMPIIIPSITPIRPPKRQMPMDPDRLYDIAEAIYYDVYIHVHSPSILRYFFTPMQASRNYLD